MTPGIRCHYPTHKKGVSTKACKVRISDEPETVVELPFCEYHAYMMISGRFTARKEIIPEIAPTRKEPEGTPKRINYYIQGPISEIETVEIVLGAIEMVRRLKEQRQ